MEIPVDDESVRNPIVSDNDIDKEQKKILQPKDPL